jgi:hypothetical protein
MTPTTPFSSTTSWDRRKARPVSHTPAGPAAETDLYVAVILDRSGSMESVRDATIEAFNGFLVGQRAEEGRTLMTLTQFDSEGIDILCESTDVHAIPLLTPQTYVPRAATPLYDAAGVTLARAEAYLASVKWPGVVLVVIITDGMENASSEWSRERIFARIRELEARGWGFMYLGAHAEAYEAAESIGVRSGSSARYAKSAAGTASMGMNLSNQSKRWRLKESLAHELITPAEREEMERA